MIRTISIDILEELADRRPDFRNRVIARIDCHELLKEISPRDRAIMLDRMRGKSLSEIGRQHKITDSAVSLIWFKSLARLRKHLKDATLKA